MFQAWVIVQSSSYLGISCLAKLVYLLLVQESENGGNLNPLMNGSELHYEVKKDCRIHQTHSADTLEPIPYAALFLRGSS